MLFVSVYRMMAYYNLVIVFLVGLSNSAVSLECPSGDMKCADGDCIPESRWCDGYSDCFDDSDEQHCSGNSSIDTDFFITRDSPSYTKTKDIRTEEQAVKRAAEFLLSQRNSYGNWDTFTPRAVVALSFASKVSAISEEEKQLMQMQLDMKLLFNLMENKDNMSLGCLSLYINSLEATCQDPRDFHGMNLVARLRSETDAAIRNKSSIPVVFLSLCLADSLTNADRYEMKELYQKNGGKTGSRALLVMAMICYLRSHPGDSLENYVSDFFSNQDLSNEDIYSKFLLSQAWIARNKLNNGYQTLIPRNTIDVQALLDEQQSDGSFGDLLSTYYAIPSLLNLSLLDLKCDNKLNTGDRSENLIMSRGKLVYSIWTPSGNDMRSHSINLHFDGIKTLYDIMLVAAKRDPLFRFSFDETDNGKVVYSIGGMPNDVESGRSWMLYSGTPGDVNMNSAQNLHQEINAVDRIQALSNKHYIFWLKR